MSGSGDRSRGSEKWTIEGIVWPDLRSVLSCDGRKSAEGDIEDSQGNGGEDTGNSVRFARDDPGTRRYGSQAGDRVGREIASSFRALTTPIVAKVALLIEQSGNNTYTTSRGRESCHHPPKSTKEMTGELLALIPASQET